ncbi:choice-of-anchor J domain-containing protein [Flavobacterium sp.]|uniref:choice-of-anchor J domain-containing protein n=1 Tax=Flavobacterium sp. TaxID=239 RepID=UPI003918C5DC
MKKITLLILLTFFTISGYSQFTPVTVEGFESTTGPDVGTNWTLATGNWAVFDNGVGTGQRWGINNTVADPPIVYAGTNAAYINRETMNIGDISEDFLATPLVNIPSNGQLRFFTRSFASGNQGTIYQIRVAPSSASQTNPAAYTVIQQWTEADLTTTFNIYEEKVVNIPAIYHNNQIYISFVKVHNQQVAGVAGSGDRWLVDNVSVLEQCLDPTTLAAGGITQTSANLSWANPSGATSWEIEVLPVAGTPTGVGVIYNGFLPFVATATATGTLFTPSTAYKYYVRARCSNGANSNWVGPFNFSTTSPGFSCAAPIVISALPYNTTDNTANYGDAAPLEGTPGGAAGCGSANAYLNGNDVVYSYTAATTGVINVTMTPTATFSGIFAYASCANIGVNCLAGVANAGTTVRTFDLPVTAGSTYYFVISTWAAPQTTGYTLTIQAVNCPPPTTLAVNNLTQTSANLTWANPGGATSWEYDVQPVAAPIPAGAGIQTSSNTINPVIDLTVNTAYRFYVRSDCGNGTFSAWAGPFVFNTLCATFPVPFQEGFNSGSPTESCWTVLNLNNDADAWDMNYAVNPFEGNQVAAINTDFNAGANNDWLISPQIVLTGNQRLKFHYRVQSTGEPNDFRVMLSTNGPTPADFTTTLIPLASYNNITYVQRIVSLAGITGPVNIGWHVPAGGLDGWRLYIDNVIIEDLPTCPEPTLVSSSNVLSTSATITWVNGNTETAWQVLALPCGSPAPTAASTGFIDVTTGSPYTLTGLSPTTCYDVYVRAVCAGNDISPWTGPATFTTQVAPPACGGTFTDPGGPNANYPNSADSTVTICPPAGQVVTVTFSVFNTETNWDALYVFDGPSITSPQIASTNGPGFVPGGLAGGYWGTTIPGPFTASGIDGCLTFRFRSDTSVNNPGWIASVSCAPAPNCPKPSALTATNITTTSAYLGWTEANPLVTSWDIIILPLGSPAPLPTDPGFFTVSANPALITGLNPGTQYTFYVRSNCPDEGESLLSNGFNFNTLLANDNCDGAIFAPVNGSAVCQQVTPGSIAGATASAFPAIAPCIGTADDDVWFQFIATNQYLNVALQNVVGTSTNLNFAVYSGQCGTLTQFFCSAANALSGVLNNLTVGNTYFIRVYSNAATPQSTTFNLCISTPSTCPTASTVCSLTNYANTTGVTSLGTIGCLGSSPNPAYFTIQVATTGPINFLLTQSSTIGGTPNLDVDYAAWGPFTSQEVACNFIGSSAPFAPPGIGVPVTQQTGCSFSAAPTETLNIANAVAGQFYIVLITNFSNQAGYINLTQTNATTPGAGTTNCCPDAFFTYSPVSYCKVPGAPNPIATITTGSVAGVFSSTIVPGLVFANTATGEVDLQASAPGNYIITNTVAQTASCVEKVKTFTINITEPTVATIAYSEPSYCRSITSLQDVIFTGATGGTYSASPNGGLFINTTTGAINPSLSAPGIYTITYSLPGSGVCTLSNPTAQVEIIASPVIVQPAPVSVCNSYTLPALTVGGYFEQPGGVSPLDISVPITSTQTVYIYAANGICTDEKSFTVTINSAQAPTLNVTQPTCSVQTGTIEVTSPTGSPSGLPSNLFISEVTDATTGALTYIEIYNGTGTAVDLSNYKLRTFNNGSTTVTSPCDNVLSGTLNHNSTFVVAVGSTTNQGGVVPNLVFASCTGVNNDDNIRLSTLSNVDIDIWGRIDGVSFTPLNQPGYTYRRNNTATVPSTTWNAADWTTTDPEDYTNIGSYTFPTSGYQYSLDNGTFQSSTIFNNVAPGDHTVTVLDLASGCLSLPVTVTLTIVPQNPSVTTFSYPTTPVCQNGTTNPVPDTSSPGFTTGGTFTSTTGLDIDPSTGVINLAGSTAATYVVTYAVVDDPLTCTQAGSSTFTIVINPVITPVTGFTYTTPVCKNGTDPTPILATGFTTNGTFSSTAGLDINPSTGVINLANSTAGTYTVTYIVNPNTSPTVCQILGASTFEITINPVITPVTTFSYTSPVCNTDANLTPITGVGFTSGGVYSSTAGLNINGTTGEITLPSTPGTYTVTYSIGADAPTCRVASSSTAQVVIAAPVQIGLTGNCEGVNFVLTATPVENQGQVTYLWENSSGANVGTTQNIVVTQPDTYTVTVTSNGCPNSSSIVVDAITCVIQKGISANNDGLNDSFDLRGFNVKNLSIFNRYGMKVYSKGNYTDQWKGQSDGGDELPDGTYYFVIERDNGETRTGWIYINRAQ